VAAFFAQLALVLTPIGWGAVAVVVAGWLAVAFGPAGKTRAVLESVAATGLFFALLALFTNLVHDAVSDGSWLRTGAFGLLFAIFSCSSVLSCVQTVQIARGAGSGPSSATH
jgi:hypothetical protein